MSLGKYAKEAGIKQCIICQKTFISQAHNRLVCDEKNCSNTYRRCLQRFREILKKKDKLLEG